MKFSVAAVAALLTAAYAVPLEERQGGAVSMMVAAPEWTIENMKRVCNSADTSCTWTFAIDTHTAPATPCKFVVTGKTASETDTSGKTCGGFTIGTGWSGQYGPGKGFTTLSVVDNAKKQIIYPAYTDTELDTNKVVKPDKSYAPQALP